MTRQELIQQIKQKQSFLCVGLDTDPKKMPQCVFDLHDPIFEFNKAIIEATAPYCVAYKPNLAFYEAYGLKGMEAFVKTCKAYIAAFSASFSRKTSGSTVMSRKSVLPL